MLQNKLIIVNKEIINDKLTDINMNVAFLTIG